MKLFDRFLLKEFVKFVLLALLCVVGIYILIDIFEEIGYFMARRVSLFTLLRYYLYYTPAAIDLLYPVSFVLSCFMVYGQLTRARELQALQSAGVNTYRLFRPVLLFGIVSVFLFYAGREYVAIPASKALDDLKRYTIDKRSPPGLQKRKDMNYLADDGKVFYAREFDETGILRGFIIIRLDPARRRVVERIDGEQAVWRDSLWHAQAVNVREFPTDTTETLTRFDSLVLVGVTETPRDFALETRPVEQMQVPELARYAERIRRAGYRVDKELTELHFRYSYPLTGLILLLMALPLATRLRRGGVMLGLGLGMLFSFLYWCAIQGSRAYGQTGAIAPPLAAWLPGILFLGAGLALMPTVRR
jgi:lipopolysaccharide export system permease protein